ncbi:hypothetical protein AGMMS50293_03530 [Spirochaetia bacterium]|nr:hypothetical protein AGMMS50293_03530 [Spirochaetia bacterium]
MDIGAVPYHAFPSVGYAISASHGGRLSLPVSPSSYIYSHFKHVSGVPAPDGVQGVNISRLKILDTLIEQLARMKKQPQPHFGERGEDAEKRINALIEQYQSQIRAAQAASSAISFAPAAAPGAVLSLNA